MKQAIATQIVKIISYSNKNIKFEYLVYNENDDYLIIDLTDEIMPAFWLSQPEVAEISSIENMKVSNTKLYNKSPVFMLDCIRTINNLHKEREINYTISK